MPWYKIDPGSGELLFGDTLTGPGYTRENSNGAAVDGWRFFGNTTAAYAALGINPKVQGPDRSIIDNAIANVISTQIQSALIAIRDNDPTPLQAVVAQKV